MQKGWDVLILQFSIIQKVLHFACRKMLHQQILVLFYIYFVVNNIIQQTLEIQCFLQYSRFSKHDKLE
jgi:hypothetical protein